MPKSKVKSWSVAGEKLKEKIRPGMPAEQIAAIEEEANERATKDVFGEGYQVDAQGKPIEQGIGSTAWLLKVSEEQAERHYASIARWIGPAAERAERERVARLKGKK